MSPNGKLLNEIIERHDLVVVNATAKCSGVITRKNVTSIRTEQSVLDYFIVCKDFFSLVSNLTVDEDRVHVMTKFSTKAGVKRIVESDHNMLICKTKVKWCTKKKKVRKEIFNYNSEEGRRKFKKILDNSNTLMKCFKTMESFETQCTKWFKRLIKIIRRCFRKIKITNKRHKSDISEKIVKVKEIKKRLTDAKNECPWCI